MIGRVMPWYIVERTLSFGMEIVPSTTIGVGAYGSLGGGSGSGSVVPVVVGASVVVDVGSAVVVVSNVVVDAPRPSARPTDSPRSGSSGAADSVVRGRSTTS